jgi:hypothetical protein
VPELDLFVLCLFMRSLARVSKSAPIYLLHDAFDSSVESQWDDEYVQNLLFSPYFSEKREMIFATCTANRDRIKPTGIFCLDCRQRVHTYGPIKPILTS